MSIELIVSVLSGMATVIPVMIGLYQLFKKYINEKNWAKVVALVLDLCAQAEKLLEDGAQKKLWVMNALQASAKEIGYELNEERLAEVSKMIDDIIAASRVINVTKTEKAETK